MKKQNPDPKTPWEEKDHRLERAWIKQQIQWRKEDRARQLEKEAEDRAREEEQQAKEEQNQRKEVLDQSSMRNRTLLIIFVSFMVFLTLTVLGTSDRDLFLPDSKIDLPLIQLKIPLLSFYWVAPLLLLALHFNLLFNLYLHGNKLRAWNSSPKPEHDTVLLPFLFNFLVALPSPTIKLLLRFFIWAVVYAWPLGNLLLFQIRFSAYQHESMTAFHMGVLAVDLLFLWNFWVRLKLTGKKDTEESASEGRSIPWATIWQWGSGTIISILVIALSGINGVAWDHIREGQEFFPPERIEIDDILSVKLERVVFVPWKGERFFEYSLPSWSDLILKPHLDLSYETLLNEKPPAAVVELFRKAGTEKSKDQKKDPKIEAWMAHAEGLILKGRSFNFANFREAILLKANLQNASLHGASLAQAQLQGASLGRAQLQETELERAHLQGADLGEAHLQGAELVRAQLQGADLGEAHLQGAELGGAQLQGADLGEAHLQGADLGEAHLQGADLGEAHLQGADLGFAQLQGAGLREAHLQGADLEFAQLQGADLEFAQLQGADLEFAQLQGAYLFEAKLQGASIERAQLDPIWYVERKEQVPFKGWDQLLNEDIPFRSDQQKRDFENRIKAAMTRKTIKYEMERLRQANDQKATLALWKTMACDPEENEHARQALSGRLDSRVIGWSCSEEK